MSGPIVYIDQSDVRPEKLAEVRAAIDALVELIESSEPQLLAYAISLDEAGLRQTVLAIHPDSASLELHMEIGAPGFRRFVGLIDLRSIDVYGTPTDKVRAQLREKATMLGPNGRVTIHERLTGFTRLSRSATTSRTG